MKYRLITWICKQCDIKRTDTCGNQGIFELTTYICNRCGEKMETELK